MSVFKRPGAETYSYDFEVGRHRFSGNTGKTTKREARAEQDRLKRIERARLDEAKGKTGANMTFSVAATRYMEEVGNFHSHALTTLSCLEWIDKQLGKGKRISEIDNETVAFLVAKRRQEYRKVGNKNTPRKLVSAATVNRTCTEPLRKVMRRAATKWNVPIQHIDWSEHMLAEPRERVREASPDEEGAFMDALDRGYDDAVAFATLTGCRRMEIVGLTWQRVDFFNRQFTVIGKSGHQRTIPMGKTIYNLLWKQKDFHPTSVFTYEARRTDKRKKIYRGMRYPMTDAGLKTALKRALQVTGIENFRFHDLRHTAATRTLRRSNLRVVQNLLGHSDPATTAKYAHALSEDIRAALDATSPTQNPSPIDGEVDKDLKKKDDWG